MAWITSGLKINVAEFFAKSSLPLQIRAIFQLFCAGRTPGLFQEMVKCCIALTC